MSSDPQNDVVQTTLTTATASIDPISTPNFEPFQNDIVFLSNQVSFVMDLIHQRIETTSDLMLGPDTCHEFRQSEIDLDLHLGFDNNNVVLDYPGGLTRAIAGSDGDWDVEFEPEFGGPGVIEFDIDDDFDPIEEYRIVSGNDNDSDDLRLPLWDSLVLNEGNENFEWEGIGGMVNEGEALDMFLGEGDAFVPVLSQEEEREGEVLDVEWEDLMNREFYFEDTLDRELSLGDQIVGRLLEVENAGIGKPPASEREVERLVIVVVGKGDVEMGNVICAVCKDDMDVGEEVREMPCCHRYHGDCILPWLRIRNTCPVCRYELPTDDPDYERTRGQRVGRVN